MAFSPDGELVYVLNPISGAVWVIDTATNNVTGDVFIKTPQMGPWGVAFTPGGFAAYVTNFSLATR